MVRKLKIARCAWALPIALRRIESCLVSLLGCQHLKTINSNKRERRFQGEGSTCSPPSALAAKIQGAPDHRKAGLDNQYAPRVRGNSRTTHRGPDLISSLIRPQPDFLFHRKRLRLLGKSGLQHRGMHFKRGAGVQLGSQKASYKTLGIGFEA